MGSSWLRLGLIVLALLEAGCGSTIRAASMEVPRTATPVFADAALGVLEAQKTQQRLDAILATPEMQHAIAEFGAGIMRGVGDNLSDEAAKARIDELVGRFSRTFVSALDHDAGDLQRLAGTLGATMTDSVLQTAAAEIPRTIEPAMQKALADSLGPAIHDAIQRDLGPSLAATMRTPEFKQALSETSRQVGPPLASGETKGGTPGLAGKKARAV